MMRVSLFVTCLVDQLFPAVGLSAVQVLRKFGAEVEFDPRQTCCGQPALNSGYVEEARTVARSFLRVFADKDWIVVPSGSCTTMICHHLPDLFEPGSEERETAEKIAGCCWEFSDFLVRVLKVTDPQVHFPRRVTYHDSCHQLRDLGVYDQPRALIRAIEGIDFVEMDESTRCCGFGGTFAVKFDEVSTAIGEDKVDSILKTGASYVISNDVSCLMHIEGLLKRRSNAVRAMHLAELLAQ